MPSSSPLSCHAIGSRWFLNALEPDKVLALIFPLAKDLGSRHGNRSHVSFRYPFCEVAGKSVHMRSSHHLFGKKKAGAHIT